ncbi:MAG TPA: Hsp20/alpha crystallin family protein [Burkholderiaceae bacterium]|nr:Hsp20/alpha crystallin family protein [Burkholderiaceae bacterium]
MSALTRFEPLGNLMTDPFSDMFRRFLRTAEWPTGMRAPTEMKVDVTENDKQYTVKAEIPGAKKDDVRVSIDGNYLSISAEIREEKETKGNGERTLLRELYYGSLSRGFTLGHEINTKESSAKFDNGILTLTLPKRAEAKGTTIKVD